MRTAHSLRKEEKEEVMDAEEVLSKYRLLLLTTTVKSKKKSGGFATHLLDILKGATLSLMISLVSNTYHNFDIMSNLQRIILDLVC